MVNAGTKRKFNPEKFVSLLFLALNGRPREEVVADALCCPEKLMSADYYLVAQMPRAELLGKTDSAIVEELARYTVSPEWKSQGRRQMAIGDIVCLGTRACLSIDELNTPAQCKSLFLPLPNVTKVKDEAGAEYAVGVIELARNKAVEAVICHTTQS